MAKKPAIEDFSPSQMGQIQRYGQALGHGEATDFDQEVEGHLANHYPKEFNAAKMRAAASGGSLELGPSEAQQKEVQQEGALQQQAATQGQVQASQAQAAQAPVNAPSAPSGPVGTQTPYPAQSAPQPPPEVTAASQSQQGEPPVIGAQRGGRVAPPAPGPTDTVPAMLTPGEFVVNRNAVRAIGPHKLEALNQAVPDQPPRGRGYQQGGPIDTLGRLGDEPLVNQAINVPQATYGALPTPGWTAPGGPTGYGSQPTPDFAPKAQPVSQPTSGFAPVAPVPLQTDYGSQPTPGFVGAPPSAPGGQPTTEQLQDMPSAQLPSAFVPKAQQVSGPFTGKETRQDVPHKSGYATVAYNNPGGMWENASSRKFGASTYGIIGGGNHIAKFDSPVQGAAAQFDLLARKYANHPLHDVITVWSGNTGGQQNVDAYVKSLGLDPRTMLTPQLLQSPVGIDLLKKQAEWEGGGHFSMSDEQWKQAQDMAFPAQ